MGQSQSQNGRKRIQKENTEFVRGIEAHRKDIGVFDSEKVSVHMYNSPRGVTKVPFSLFRLAQFSFSCLLQLR
jgi:hypothetical protein